MRHRELYSKYKVNYPPIQNPLFSRKNWWRILLITVMAVLIEPLLMYRHQRSVPFSVDDYLKLSGYFLAIIIPFVAFLFWINWRESIKRNRGYGWVGKFEVVALKSSFLFYYLLLEPDSTNKIRVERSLFEKTRVGDVIQIRRDALGKIEEISKVNFSSRVAKSVPKRES